MNESCLTLCKHLICDQYANTSYPSHVVSLSPSHTLAHTHTHAHSHSVCTCRTCQLEEAKWREKSLIEDVAVAARKETMLQESVSEMDTSIMQLEEAKTNLHSMAETRRRTIEKCNIDLTRAAEESKAWHAQVSETAAKMTTAKDEYEKTLKIKISDLSNALGAIEQMHTVVCQPEVGIAQGLGITLVEGAEKEGCKVESIVENGVAESEGTLKPGDILLEVDEVDVKACTFEEIHGLLVGVAGSSVTICGMHAPYQSGDEFAAVVVRSGFGVCPTHPVATIQVDELCDQVLKGAGELRNVIADLRSQHRKLSDKVALDHVW